MTRTVRACQICGRPFRGGSGCHYCPGCAREKKLDTVVRIRTCQDCGAEFSGGPRARRCPECARRACQKTWRQYRKTGPARPLGSTDHCVICGAPYTVRSGRQMYCSVSCQRKGVLAWQREHKRGYGRTSGQDAKKAERRRKSAKICVYCLRPFSGNGSSNLCSPYCRTERGKLLQCIADVKRGKRRNLEKYEKRMEEYREECRNDRHTV